MSFQLGRYSADVVSAGTFGLDGGAMFGIIPKPLWEKQAPADEHNRITLGTNCLLLRDGVRVILVDCGMGESWNEKQRGEFNIQSAPLASSLRAVGVGVDDVTDLLLTHLHFDHAGGATALDAHGALAMTFPAACVHVGRRNWTWAHAPNERDRGSYRPESWLPLDSTEAARLVLHDDLDGRCDVLPEITGLFCEGHTTGQLLPLVGALDQRALYAADMVPMRAHVRMPWLMGYDLRPLTLLDEKRQLLSLCADEGVALLYEHDPVVIATSIVRDRDDFKPGAPPAWATLPAGAPAAR